jgi:DNA-directed RNA polymerase III subunit RPC1
MQRISKLSGRWLSDFGMTIGISDVTPSEDLKLINQQEIMTSYELYDNYLNSYKKGELEAKPGMSKAESL